MNAPTNPDAYGTLIEPTTLKIQRLLPGPIERCWAYLTESDMRRQWLAEGEMEMKLGASVELEPYLTKLCEALGQSMIGDNWAIALNVPATEKRQRPATPRASD